MNNELTARTLAAQNGNIVYNENAGRQADPYGASGGHYQ